MVIFFTRFAPYVLGGLFFIIYLITLLVRKKHGQLEYVNGAIVFLGGAGIVGGGNLIYCTCNDSIICPEGVDKIYLILGGIAIIWVGLSEFIKRLK